uniref:Uncharacterized protein n=1 Tax=Setaria viridis TaxID=4556 RepID=A0A4U6UIE5_SETVI|nr:hypothetical protein SEVIR_6G152100v2 [Setaria viridis]
MGFREGIKESTQMRRMGVLPRTGSPVVLKFGSLCRINPTQLIRFIKQCFVKSPLKTKLLHVVKSTFIVNEPLPDPCYTLCIFLLFLSVGVVELVEYFCTHPYGSEEDPDFPTGEDFE